jgi:hypothetical protein
MRREIIHELVTEFDLPLEEVLEGVNFALGGDAAQSKVSDPEAEDLLRNYFYTVYGSRFQQQEEANHLGDITRLSVKNWRQFADVDIDLSSRLVILTGENGTGKTSILNLISQLFGDGVQFLGTPVRDDTGFRFAQGRGRPTGAFQQIGVITFSSGANSRVGIREWESNSQPYFTPEFVPQRTLSGLFLDAQRVIGPYQRLESIPPRFNSAGEIAYAFREQLRNMYVPHQMLKSPSLLIKEALVAAAMYGEGNASVVEDPRAREIWLGFQDILRTLFPVSLRFQKLQIDQGEVVIVTEDGPFALEAASGGLAAIVSLSWQIYLHAVDAPAGFTVCFDEPENHLHPLIQKSLLPSLLQAFPDINFIVATHSPFVVTSSRDARVIALRRNSHGGVYSQEVQLNNRAFTAEEIFDEVLGVGATLPLWAESSLRSIISEYRSSSDSISMRDLTIRLEAAGLRVTTPRVSDAIIRAIDETSE